MKYFKGTPWITLVLIFISTLSVTDSFQCFECENCPTIEGGDKVVFIKDCEPLEFLFTEGIESSTEEGFASTASSIVTNSTRSSSSSTSSNSQTLINKTETLSSVQIDVSTTTKSTLGTTTEKQKTTESWSIFPKSMDSGACYVLKFKYEGETITKRGCGLRGQNKEQICEAIGKNKTNLECEVCEGSLCNSGSRLRSGIIGLVLAILFFKIFLLL